MSGRAVGRHVLGCYVGGHRVPSRVPRLVVAIAGFVSCVVAANALTATFGLVPVGLGLTATAGTWAAGVVLAARDWVHELGGRWAVAACVAGGALLSAVLAGPLLAAASAVAFAVSELVDAGVYEPLRELGWVPAVLGSNLVGAGVDSVLFLTVAGFPLTAAGGQVWVKTAATVVLVVGVVSARAVLRHRLRGTGP